VLLAGCFPATVGALKQSGISSQFVVERGYQEVFRDVVRFETDCHSGGSFLATLRVQSMLYPDLKGGELTVQ
jgi:hypothetical protein